MPLTIQTTVLAIALSGANLLIEQNAIGRPSGIPTINVTAKIISDIINPLNKNAVISKNDIKNSLYANFADKGFSPCQLCINFYLIYISNYFWSAKSLIAVVATPYLSASAAMVPSAPSVSSSALTFAVSSLPFLNPIA